MMQQTTAEDAASKGTPGAFLDPPAICCQNSISVHLSFAADFPTTETPVDFRQTLAPQKSAVFLQKSAGSQTLRLVTALVT
jgi:hypothetical protein